MKVDSGLRDSLGILLALLICMMPDPGQARVTAETPSLQLEGLDDQMHTLDELRGQVVLLNFWASWCAPCQQEIPDLTAWQAQHGEAGLQVIGVGIDQERKLRNVARSLEINYPVWVLDPREGGAVLAAWGNAVGMVPYSVVLDRSGRTVHRLKGVLNQDTFDRLVRPLLEAESSTTQSDRAQGNR